MNSAAALPGDHDAFKRLTAPHAREIHLHCYHMLGSFHDAEDAVQETFLRAWKYFASHQDDASFRAWLYRIATNVCLRHRAHRAKDRLMRRPSFDGIEPNVSVPFTLTPYPDALLEELEAPLGNPGAEYDLYESVQLAFLATMQLLPPRQRAVLILHDVVGFTAAEVANLLETTVASVNGALNRARATLKQQRASGRILKLTTVPANRDAEDFVERCVAAWQAADIGQLANLLKADVVMGAPALGLVLHGRSAVCEYLASVPAVEDRESFRFIATRANRQPAVAVYRLNERFQPATYRALAMVVLTVDGDVAVSIHVFPDPKLMLVFGLPTQL
jgi:RNA polymerase sigma-70 factor (TIGR02960 family)